MAQVVADGGCVAVAELEDFEEPEPGRIEISRSMTPSSTQALRSNGEMTTLAIHREGDELKL